MNNDNIVAINAIVDGLNDGGCEYSTNFPGFNSHNIFKKLGGSNISLNEKVAIQKAFGASLAGKRSLTLMKGTGLNAALDEYLHIMLNGINSGLVIILTEDLEGESSPEIQDSRAIIDMYGGLWFEPYSNQNAYDLSRISFETSEKLDVPIVIRLTNNYFRNKDNYQRNERVSLSKSAGKVDRRRSKYISHWKPRYENLQIKKSNIQSFVDNLYNLPQKFKSIISGSSSLPSSQVQEALRIYTYPLPSGVIDQVLDNHKPINVFENGDGYVDTKISALLGKSSQVVHRILDSKKEIPIWNQWVGDEKIFKALKKISPSYVVADEGTFTDESTKTNNVCLCMGSAVGITMGLAESGIKYPFCISGDTSFSFGNVHALFEAKSCHDNFCVIVINNGGSLSTGGQEIMYDFSTLNVCKTITVKYDTTSILEFTKIIRNIRKENELTILYVNK